MITNMLKSLYESEDFWNSADLDETCSYVQWLKVTNLTTKISFSGGVS